MKHRAAETAGALLARALRWSAPPVYSVPSRPPPSPSLTRAVARAGGVLTMTAEAEMMNTLTTIRTLPVIEPGLRERRNPSNA